MGTDLWSALCLVAVIEGLFLFLAPGAWRRAAEQLQNLPDLRIRQIGGIILAIGLCCLVAVRGVG